MVTCMLLPGAYSKRFWKLIVFNQPQIVQPCIINKNHTELLFQLLKQLYSHYAFGSFLLGGRARSLPGQPGPCTRPRKGRGRLRRAGPGACAVWAVAALPLRRMRRCAGPLLRLAGRRPLPLRHGAAAFPAASFSSSSSPSDGSGGSRAPDTSLFVPVPLKPVGDAAEEDVGAELTRPLDKGGCGMAVGRSVCPSGRRSGRGWGEAVGAALRHVEVRGQPLARRAGGSRGGQLHVLLLNLYIFIFIYLCIRCISCPVHPFSLSCKWKQKRNPIVGLQALYAPLSLSIITSRQTRRGLEMFLHRFIES